MASMGDLDKRIDEHVNAGVRHLKYGEYEGAYNNLWQAYNKVSESEKQTPSLRYIKISLKLGEALNGLKKHSSAIKYFDYIIRNGKGIDNVLYSEALGHKGFALSELNELTAASKFFDWSLRRFPNSPNVLNNKGYMLLKLGEDEEAFECFENGLHCCDEHSSDFQETYALLLRNIATIKSRQNEHPQARDTLDKALTYVHQWEIESEYSDKPILKKTLFSLNLHYGIALASQGKTEEAIPYCRRALDLDPQNLNALNHLAYVLRAEKKYEEAQALLNRALLVDPYNASALMGLGAIQQAIAAEAEELQVEFNFSKFQNELLSSQSDLVGYSVKYLHYLLVDFHNGLNVVKTMFQVQFTVGFLVIIGAIVAAVLGASVLFASFLGALGGGTILLSAYDSCPGKLQKNRVDFAQWMMAYFNWINAFYASNIFITRKFESEKKAEQQPDWKGTKEVFQHLNDLTRETVLIIEECCEYKQGTPQKKDLEDAITAQAEKFKQLQEQYQR